MNKFNTLVANNLQTTKLYLIIIPVGFLISSIIIHSYYGLFYQRVTDPEYFHLLNGINIALFNLATPYVDHPGTPLQIIVALASWPVSLFLPGSISDNVIDNPELFLTASIILMNIIIALVMYYSGRRIYGYSKNIWLSLIIQLMPFGNIYALNVFGRLTPESLMIVPIMLMVTSLIGTLYDEDYPKITNKKIVFLAMISGLGMAIKFSYLPFLILPVFIFRKFPQLLKYGLFSIVFTLLFAFPILFNISKSISWFGNMAINSGHWGEGSSGFMVWSEIPEKLWLLVKLNYLLPSLLIIVVFLTIFSFIKRMAYPKTARLNHISTGIILSIAFSMFLITKHFAYRYYFPTLLFQTTLLYLIIEYVGILTNINKLKSVLSIVAFFGFLCYVLIQVPTLGNKMKKMAAEHNEYSIRSEQVLASINEDIPIIIDAHFSGSPFKEFALNNAYLLCGNLKTTFQDKLRKDYPRSIFYVSWSESFFHWNHFWDADEFIDPETGLFVFMGEGKDKNLEIIMDRLEKSFPVYKVNYQLILGFENPSENIYKITFSQ